MPTHLARTRVIPVPPDAVWEVLADFGAISRWAPNADHSALLTPSTDGPGAARRVQAGRNVLVETVTAWEPPSLLRYRIEGLPRRVGSITNEWRLEPLDQAGHSAPAGGGPATNVTLTTTVDTGPRPPQRLIERLVVHRLAKESTRMLDGLASVLTTGAPR